MISFFRAELFHGGHGLRLQLDAKRRLQQFHRAQVNGYSPSSPIGKSHKILKRSDFFAHFSLCWPISLPLFSPFLLQFPYSVRKGKPRKLQGGAGGLGTYFSLTPLLNTPLHTLHPIPGNGSWRSIYPSTLPSIIPASTPSSTRGRRPQPVSLPTER